MRGISVSNLHPALSRRAGEGINGVLGNFVGAFVDTAVLFPLLAALSIRSDFSGTILLASAGIAYLAAGIFFRIPMSVQPLKAVAIAAIATGASSSEVRLAGAVLGLICLGLSFINVDYWTRRVPKGLIQGIQASLGVLLILQGLAFAKGIYFPAAVVLAFVIGGDAMGLPLMGILATAGVVWGVAHAAPPIANASNVYSGARFGIIASLALPQVALTLSNSVIGTADAAKRYFGARAEKATERNLLRFIGFGNLAAASTGGLPFCHGSGGLTAHVRGGARTWGMNIVIGIFLLVLSGWQYANGGLRIPYPPLLLGAILAATGIFHLQLARPTWALGGMERVRLLAMGLGVLFTHNILWALAAGLMFDVKRYVSPAKTEVRRSDRELIPV